ncbi:autotransporter domain-containing protein [Luteimonas sp. SX5]|uniref:Autotransporter domain-containing protein n=1 Tax=Luteimonas galliterrae TaxID=2940486 RepID=A0ABT0MKF3_9GAMM|nr:autotransporter domain-containing protein [Luteimonas galliterrae]MCL1635372.1 autotransporter domain-containing protein [Luteimonas galliterrae]
MAAALALTAAPALAQTYSQTVFFGDSLTDAGYFRPLLPPEAQPVIGQFTTNPGWVWSQYVADYYGTGATPNGNGQNGTNYAAGGARVGVDTSGALGPIPSLATQTTRYLAANGGRADPNALYTVWGGANDLFAVAADPSQAPAIIGGAVTAQAGIVATLKGAGARYIVVPTIPDIGLTPSSRAGGAVGMAQGTALATAYNNALFGALGGAGLRVIPLDTFHFLQEAVANPGLYGFRNVTDPACVVESSLTCSPLAYVSPDAANAYLFADGVHPTVAAHQILSQLAVSALEGPRQIALLPHSAATIGRARADRVSAHRSGKPDADGMRWWADVRGDNQRFDKGGTGAGFDGGGPTLTFGVDWASGNLVYGAFAGYGRQKIDFGGRAGDFDQSDTSLGGFLGWHGEQGLWANAQVSYTKLAFDVDRKVNLGPATRTHSGSPDGDNLSIGIDAGWEFGDGALRHGPVIGLLSQRIDVDGYAESQPALSSSLAFPEQNYDSLIGSAGWQASYAINDHVKPYAQLTYDREFEDYAEEAFARAQSLPGTGTYAVPGLDFDRDYGTLVLGVQSAVFGLDANIGASVTVGQEEGNNASVFATLGKGF